MKKSFFILAVALLSFTTVAFAGNAESPKNKLQAPQSDTIVSAPQSLVETRYVKTIEETIAEDVMITETVIEQARPCVGKTIEEIIAEDNKIIESDIANEKVYLLDFKKINRNSNFPKASKILAGM